MGYYWLYVYVVLKQTPGFYFFYPDFLLFSPRKSGGEGVFINHQRLSLQDIKGRRYAICTTNALSFRRMKSTPSSTNQIDKGGSMVGIQPL